MYTSRNKKGRRAWLKGSRGDDLTWCSVLAGCLWTECRWGGCWRQKARLPRLPQRSELAESDQRLPSCQILRQHTYDSNKGRFSDLVSWAIQNERGQLVSPLTMLFLMVTSGQTAIQQDSTESCNQGRKNIILSPDKNTERPCDENTSQELLHFAPKRKICSSKEGKTDFRKIQCFITFRWDHIVIMKKGFDVLIRICVISMTESKFYSKQQLKHDALWFLWNAFQAHLQHQYTLSHCINVTEIKKKCTPQFAGDLLESSKDSKI